MSLSSDFIYFIAQTGVLRDTPPWAPTNYYVYRIHARFRSVVEDYVNRTAIGDSGFEYPEGAIEWLDDHDTQWPGNTQPWRGDA